MKQNRKKYRLRGLVLPVLAAAMAAALMMQSDRVLPSVRGALLLCYQAVVPSLFPFFVLAGIIIGGGAADCLARCLRPVMRPLFHVGGVGALALVIGLISGYPMGASVIGSLYRSGKITQDEAERLLPFCNNSGPLFIIGAVGTGMLGSAQIGLFLYGVHAAAALCVGLCFRNRRAAGRRRGMGGGAPTAAKQGGLMLISDSVTAAVRSILTVCGYVIFFAAVTACVAPMADRFLPPWVSLAVKGMLEVTNGVYLLAQSVVSDRVMLTAVSFCVGFGGVCVFLQAASMLAGSGLSMRSYAVGKLLHGVIAAVATFLFYPFFAQRFTAVFAPCDNSIPMSVPHARLGSGITALCVAIAMIFLYITFKKRRKEFNYLANSNKN